MSTKSSETWAGMILQFTPLAVACGLLSMVFLESTCGEYAFKIGFIGAFLVGGVRAWRMSRILLRRTGDTSHLSG